MTLLNEMEQLVTGLNQEDKFSGTVLIERNGDVLFKAAKGYANRSWRIKNRLDTRFRIASVAKMFTAAAVLQLIEEGKFSFATRIVNYLGLERTRISPEINIYQLLTMTSGMGDWFEESGNWEEDWEALCRNQPLYLLRSNEDFLPLFADLDPNFPPGERHQYNGAGYILLGMAISKASGLAYNDNIQRRIFDPLGMSRSGSPALDDPAEEVAEGYIPITDEGEKVIGWKKNVYSTTPEPVADGGATSTAGDLVKFSRALREGKLLSPEMTAEMLEPKVVQNEDMFRGYHWRYGYGLNFIFDQEEEVVRWGHTGEEDGVSCRLYYYPNEDLDMIILGNQSWCAGKLGWEIHDLIMNTKP